MVPLTVKILVLVSMPPMLHSDLPLCTCSCCCSYCIAGDGCMMEGISTEASSLAGHWGLGKMIMLYDDNKISIDGHTEISFTEDVLKRYEGMGWHVLHVKVCMECITDEVNES